MTPYYDADGVTLYHADCLELLSEWDGYRIGSGMFDLLLTDPPYGIAFAAQPTKWQRQHGQRPEDWDVATAPKAVALARGLSQHAIVWGGNYYDLPPSRCWLAWVKPDAPPSMGNVEYAWTNFDQNSRWLSWSISATNKERVGHPTQKPEAVTVWALSQAPASVRLVFDPFAGSGTTLVAAKRLGKQAVGIEREEKYCEIAAERLRQRALGFEE